jgi:sulfate transport system ATP-binding protein
MIKIENLLFKRNKRHVLSVEGLHVQQGERIALLGPSGSGKTTLLRIIAGLEKENEGSIRLNGEIVSGVRYVPPFKRRLNMLTQEYGLWDHLTSIQHLALVRSKGKSLKPDDSDSVLLSQLGLDHLKDIYPSKLSGGEKQRLALARTLAIKSEILLLDEPFSNVDAVLSRELMRILDKQHEIGGLTRIMVTHDIEGAIKTSNRLVIVEGGKLVQQGTWQELCMNPKGEWCGRLVEMYGR